MTPMEQNVFTDVRNFERKPCLPAVNHGNFTEEIETFKAKEMTMLCLKCGNYLNLSYLQEHRSFHEALSIFHYDIDKKPNNADELTSQRSVLVKNLTQTNVNAPEYFKELGKIDLAYEILKSDMCGRSNKPRLNVNDLNYTEVKIRSHNSKLNNRTSIGVCQTCNEKWKSVMEDAYCYKTDLLAGAEFFAVYDGYNGPTAARQCAKNLHCALKTRITALGVNYFYCNGDNCELAETLQKTYKEMDNLLLLGEGETSRNRWSGCSSTTALICDTHLHVANAGNVKAICIKSDMTIQTLTEEHTLENKKERKRVKKLVNVNTWLKTTWTSGAPSTTRGLGNHGDPFLKSTIINVPGFSCVVLDDAEQIFLLGSGGFWEVFDENEVLVLLQDWLETKEIEINESGAYGMVEGWENLGNPNVADNITTELPNNEKGVTKIVVSNCQEVNSENDHISDETSEKGKNDICDNNDISTNRMSDEMSKNSECLFSNSLRNIKSQLGSCEISQEISKYLVSAALNGGAKSNVTVMVVLVNEK